MTLTELKYIVAVARERHFGRAAEACHISQPTLSVSVKKLEEELNTRIFERSSGEVTITPTGAAIIEQAQAVLEQAAGIREIASRAADPLSGALRLGIIHTVAPYLLPALVRQNIRRTPNMPLVLQESFTHELLNMLRTGEIDCAILAEPFSGSGLATAPLYEEPFIVAMPSRHRLAGRKNISAEALKNENLLLLGTGHCFRDHVLAVCPEHSRTDSSASNGRGGTHAIQRSFEGSSLETMRYMVQSGMGITVMPILSVDKTTLQNLDSQGQGLEEDELFVKYVPFDKKPPSRRIVLVWRRSFTRYEAIAELRNAIYACELFGVRRLT